MADGVAPPLLLRQEQYLKGLRQERYSFWVHWREIAEYIIPRRYRWLITPNESRRGSIINQRILDSTGTIALRTLSGGMMSGITSPTRPWFKLKVGDDDGDPTSDINVWLSEVERRMARVLAESNFYTSFATVYEDLGGFGSSCMYIHEDYDNVINCTNSCAGEYYFANGANGRVNRVYREFTMTLDQIIEEFDDDGKVPDRLKSLLSSNGGNASKEYVIVHALEPNTDGKSKVPARFKFRETYWISGQTDVGFLREKGYHEWPVVTPRWDVSGNDAYGRSPAMDALGDVKQLQQETKRKAQAIDKMVTPPMLADITMKNQPASLIPGGITYVTGIANSIGMKPIYTVQPPVQELMQDIAAIQDRIKNIFFNSIFMMFQNMEAEPRSAAAIDARREEKLIMLGPVLERIENEALNGIIDRVFGIMMRGGLLPPPPQKIAGGAFIRIEYVSMLAEAQRTVATGAYERFWAQVGSIAAARPDALDIPNWDEGLIGYASLLSLDPKAINSPAQIAQLRAQRQQQLAAQQQAQVGQAAVQGAQTLSQTDVGGGQNALQAMLGR